MDSEPPEAAMPGPLITVEPAPFESDAGEESGWAHGRRVAAYRAVAPGECPHRISVRDLQGSKQIVFLLAAVPVYGSALQSLLSLVFGGVMIGKGFGESDAMMILVGSVMAVLAATLVVGFVACVRVWRGLHRPELAVCVLSTVVSPLILAFVAALAYGGGWPWLMLLVVPPVAPMLVLWYFRTVLHSRETCAGYPWLPASILAMRRV
jgi:hypothetical protein